MSDIALAELRMYSVEQGRMEDMKSRYRDHLTRLFERHGVTVAAAWECLQGPQTPLFVYLMHWKSWDLRVKAWQGFYGDTEWPQVREATNQGTELVERYDLNFLKPIVALASHGADLPQEMEMYISKVKVGKGALAQRALEQTLSADDSTSICGAYEFLSGNDLPRSCIFVQRGAHQDQRPVWEQAPFDRADVYQLKTLT